jgi:hypothetical protein
MSKWKTAIVAIALLAAVGLVNYAIKMDPKHLVERGVGLDHHHHGEEGEEGEHAETLDLIGPDGAPAKLDVFYEDDNECMAEFQPLMRKIAEEYAPHVQVEFKPTRIEANRDLADKLRLGCASGIALNGEVVKEVPGLGELGLVALRGPPGQKDYDATMLRKAIEHELETRGVEFTPPPPEKEAPATHQH